MADCDERNHSRVKIIIVGTILTGSFCRQES